MTFEIRDPNWSTDAGAQAITSLIAEKPDVMVIHNPDVQSYATPAQEGRGGRHLRHPGQHAVELLDRRIRRRRLCRHGREIGQSAGREVLAGQWRQRKGLDHPGRADGRGERLSDEGHRQRPVEASRDQGRVEPGRRLGCDEGPDHHGDRPAAESRPVRHRRLLGRDGCRHGRGHQGSQARTSI